ncbi:tetratricopeptide repeat protein [Bacillaceae bacterium W0354]
MNLGAMIQYYRTKKGLTQKELANGICSVSYLSKIENGSIETKQDIIQMLFDRLDVNYIEITSYDTQTINEKILSLYKRITENNLKAAKNILTDLKRIITPFHQKESQNLFELIHLYYLIENKNSDEVERRIQNVIDLKDYFTGEHTYYYHKIIGVYYNFRAYPSMAIDYFYKAKAILEKLSIKDPELYYLLAISYTRMQQPAHSIYYCQIALEQFTNDLLYARVTDCYNLLGINYMQLGVYDIAKSYFHQILNSRPMGDVIRIKVRSYHNLGLVYYEQGDYDQALHYINKALDFDYVAYDKVQTHFVKANIYYFKRDLERAKKYLKIGEQELSKTKSLKFQNKFYILRHQINNTLDSPEFIRKAENVLIPYFQTVGETKTLKLLFDELGDIFYKKGNYQKAAEYYKWLSELKK